MPFLVEGISNVEFGRRKAWRFNAEHSKGPLRIVGEIGEAENCDGLSAHGSQHLTVPG
jgi:hypothetical protein